MTKLQKLIKWILHVLLNYPVILSKCLKQFDKKVTFPLWKYFKFFYVENI